MKDKQIIQISRASDNWIAGLLDAGIITVDENGYHVADGGKKNAKE